MATNKNTHVETPIDLEEKETTYTFMDKISNAQMNGDKWVTTSKKIMNHYNRRGLGEGVKHFIFHGIHVCEEGMVEEIEAQMQADMNRLKHGAREAFIESRANAQAPIINPDAPVRR